MRLIDGDELKKKLQARHDNGDEDFDKGYNVGLGTAIDLIDCAPTVEKTINVYPSSNVIVQERPHGKWIIDDGLMACSLCQGIVLKRHFNYCPNCGAEMRGGEE